MDDIPVEESEVRRRIKEPSTPSKIQPISFEEFAKEYVRKKKLQHENLKNVRPESPSSSLQAPPPPSALRRHVRLIFDRVVAMAAVDDIFSFFSRVFIGSVILFQSISITSFFCTLAIYLVYQLSSFLTHYISDRFVAAWGVNRVRRSFLATLIYRYTSRAQAEIVLASASSRDQRNLSDSAAANETPPEGASSIQPSDATLGVTNEYAASPAEEPRPPAHLVFLYCFFNCIWVFIISLSPWFSLDQLDERLQLDGIVHFET